MHFKLTISTKVHGQVYRATIKRILATSISVFYPESTVHSNPIIMLGRKLENTIADSGSEQFQSHEISMEVRIGLKCG